MPRLMATDEDQVISIPGPGNFQFSGQRFETLGASEYTLGSIICDISGSVKPFKDHLLNAVKMVVGACRKSPRAENLLLRFLIFNESVIEVHGFKELNMIDENAYKDLEPSGMTALFDATFNGIGATIEMARQLIDQDFFNVNGCNYIITDGMDNRSKVSPSDIYRIVEAARSGEQIESMNNVLISLKDPSLRWNDDIIAALDRFKNEAGIDQFVDIGDATPQKLAKLANFVSQSISSQSQALGTGAASQQLQF
jgi:hypothetical protein